MRRFDFFNLISLLLCVGSFVMLFSIGWSLLDRFTFMQRAPTAIVKGKILDVTFSPPRYTCSSSSSGDGPPTSHCDYDSSDSCNARVQFSTNQEQRREIIYQSGQDTLSECRKQVGKMIDVAYYIADPRDARVPPPEVSLLEMMSDIFLILFFLLIWLYWWFGPLLERWR